MVNGNNTLWDSVEQWSPTLFLIGGALLVGHAAVQGIKTFTALAPPPDVFVTTGHLAALVGLVGLYPVILDRMPKLSRAAVAVIVVPLVGWLVMTVTQFLAVAGIVSSLADALPETVIMLVLVSTILTYVLFGVATLRVGEGSRIVGLLVFVPAALFVVSFVASAITGASDLIGFIFGAGFALSMLALGYQLRSWERPTEYPVPVGDAPAG